MWKPVCIKVWYCSGEEVVSSVMTNEITSLLPWEGWEGCVFGWKSAYSRGANCEMYLIMSMIRDSWHLMSWMCILKSGLDANLYRLSRVTQPPVEVVWTISRKWACDLIVSALRSKKVKALLLFSEKVLTVQL